MESVLDNPPQRARKNKIMGRTAVTAMRNSLILFIDDDEGVIYLSSEDNKKQGFTLKLTPLESKVLGNSLTMHSSKAELYIHRKHEKDD